MRPVYDLGSHSQADPYKQPFDRFGHYIYATGPGAVHVVLAHHAQTKCGVSLRRGTMAWQWLEGPGLPAGLRPCRRCRPDPNPLSKWQLVKDGLL